MIGQNNSTTTAIKARPIALLKRPTLVGAYAMSTSTTNGYYSLTSTVLATLDADHGFSVAGSTIGEASFYIYNVTQGTTQKISLPLRLFVALGTSVFFSTGSAELYSTRWDSLGLTMPNSGDTVTIRCMIHLKGYMATGGYKQTFVAV
ncbi:MAG: hypothetical protein VXB01_09265 [Opitutae bacterium]